MCVEAKMRDHLQGLNKLSTLVRRSYGMMGDQFRMNFWKSQSSRNRDIKILKAVRRCNLLGYRSLRYCSRETTPISQSALATSGNDSHVLSKGP